MKKTIFIFVKKLMNYQKIDQMIGITFAYVC